MESSRRQYRGWLITGVALLVAAWAFIAKLIFETRAQPTESRHSLTYEVGAVAPTSALILAEAAVLWMFLTQFKGPLWIRTSMTSLVTLIVVAALVLMRSTGYSPPAYDLHLAWLFWMSGALALVSLSLGIARLIERPRERSSG